MILTKDKDYWFVPNVTRMVLARHINQVMRVTGKLNAEYRSIRADTIEVLERGAWRKTWSLADERDMRDEDEQAADRGEAR